MRSPSASTAGKQFHAVPEAPGRDMDAFFPIPIEVMERVLVSCSPRDVVVFASTCRLAYMMVFYFADQHLWRELFFSSPFDDPRPALRVKTNDDTLSIDWRRKIIERSRAKWVVQSFQPRSCQTSRALEAFIDMVHDMLPVAQTSPQAQSHNVEWLERVLRDSDLLNVEPDIPRSEAMPYAQLRAYLALSFDKGHNETNRLRLVSCRKQSRIYVYNFRNYFGRHFGPFLDDGSADWIHIEHLVNVMVLNLRQLPGIWSNIKPPLGLPAIRPYSVLTNGRETSRDWARVEGTWRRYVSFMDFRDLFAFNFYNNRKIDPTFFDCPRFREATRLLELKFYLIDAEKSRFRDELPQDVNEKFPPLYFAGSSQAFTGSEAYVEGVVHMTPDGVVRWQFTSVHPEGARWRSDGAQIGNIASATGVVGVWTTEYHHQDDAIGPFWLWKVRDDFPVQLMEYSR